MPKNDSRSTWRSSTRNGGRLAPLLYNAQRPNHRLGQQAPLQFLLQHQPRRQRCWTHIFSPKRMLVERFPDRPPLAKTQACMQRGL
ncbi:hypothetical protein FR698_09400 [Pelomicrobium methylotrophicum]|uniref:Uncharacterized protein n=1 Tax=Pelomicrobium methylotrophicum TaxID=2602750 RepID=A0A5C7EU57_9PROT|nr:hypothetical protein FR698_09400 [Pelomicrobium methylotrophicum]